MRMAQKLKWLLGHFHFEEEYDATQGTQYRAVGLDPSYETLAGTVVSSYNWSYNDI